MSNGTIKVGDTVIYRTPMLKTVAAKVTAVTVSDESDDPLLDLTFTDPTFNQEFTVHEIEAEPADFPGLPHTWTKSSDQEAP